MREDEYPKWIYLLGLIPTIWLAILIAPLANGGLPNIVKNFSSIIDSPFNLSFCKDTPKVIIIFIVI